MSKISVLLCESEDERFSAYCQERGYKKSTLIARLVRDHLNGEGFAIQQARTREESQRNPTRSHAPRHDRGHSFGGGQ